MWWKSAVNFSFFLSFATFRMRSSACDTLTRLCARHVLCRSAFPLVPALGSTSSAAGCTALFAGFAATTAEFRLLGLVHRRLRLLAFPMRTIVRIIHSTPMVKPEISQLPMRSLCT